MPRQLGDRRLVGGFAQAHHGLFLYARSRQGPRRLAVLSQPSGDAVVLDFDRYARAPQTKPGDAAFVDQDLTWAHVEGDIVFVQTTHRTYASSSGGKNAYITALELSTGQLRWRSAPLVANAGNFLVYRGWLITGYGFTAEPDFLFVLDPRTGQIARKVRLKKGPRWLLEHDGELHVRTYDSDDVFALR